MDTVDRIQKILEHAGVPKRKMRRELERVCGISYQAVSQWFTRETNNIRNEHLASICDAYGCSMNWLVTGRGEMLSTRREVEPNVVPAYFREQKSYPVINWVQAGEFTEAVDLYAEGYAEEWEYTDAGVGQHAFWLRVNGDSMTAPAGFSPSIPHGHYILVDPEAPAENGSLVVAKIDSSDKATFKKLVFDGDDKYLKPLNPAYRTISINGNCRIVGVVKEAKLKL